MRWGWDPTPEMLECYEKISRRSHDLPGDMELIKRELCEKKEERRKGAYFCDYRTFTEICHISRRNMERLGKSIYLMLCTLSDYEGKAIRNPEKLKLRASDLEQVICGCLRDQIHTKASISYTVASLADLHGI